MLVDPALWTAFDNAKEALLEAIKTSPLPESHILSLDLTHRESAKTSRHEAINALDACTTRLEETMNELNSAIRLRRSRVQTSLSSIAMLPPELVRHIVKLVIGGPQYARRIRNLSHISVAWRNIATSTSELFTESNWNKWHVDLITIWLNRSHNQPQKIFLDSVVIEPLFRYNTAQADNISEPVGYMGQLWERLEQALLNCVHLHIFTDSSSLWSGSHFETGFRSWGVPRLEYLEIETDKSGSFAVPENAPALRTLNVFNRFPQFHGSLLITNMTCMPSSDRPWSEWAEMINRLRSLGYLNLRFGNEWFDEAPPLHLPLLHTLELHGCEAFFWVRQGQTDPELCGSEYQNICHRPRSGQHRA